MMRKLMRQIYY